MIHWELISAPSASLSGELLSACLISNSIYVVLTACHFCSSTLVIAFEDNCTQQMLRSAHYQIRCLRDQGEDS